MKMNSVLISSCIMAFVATQAIPVFAKDQKQTIEAVAEKIARNHNTQNISDEMTVSSTAQAIGKNVIFRNVLRVKKGLPPAKLAEFKNAIEAETIPKVCEVNKETFTLRTGLYYTFIYDNTYGEQLANFVVNEKTCGFK